MNTSSINLLIANKDTAKWFSFHQNLQSVTNVFEGQQEIEAYVKSLKDALERTHLYAPKKLYLLTEHIIKELDSISPKTFFQKIGINLTQQQNLSKALTKLIRGYPIQDAAFYETEIQEDILNLQTSKIFNVVKSIKRHIEILIRQRDKLSEHDRIIFTTSIEFLSQQNNQNIEKIEELNAEINLLNEEINAKDEEIQVLTESANGLNTQLKLLQDELKEQKFMYDEITKELRDQKKVTEELKGKVDFLLKHYVISTENQHVNKSQNPDQVSTETHLKTPSKPMQKTGSFWSKGSPSPVQPMSYSPGFESFLGQKTQLERTTTASEPITIARQVKH